MKKIFYILFITIFSISINNASLGESKLDKIKNKIKTTEKKFMDGIWGSKDCSHISTKTMSGLSKYNKCKRGIDASNKNLTKKKKNNKFDPNKPCDEYSTKTFTGLAAKLKCKRAKKN
tara:strand:+ start:216 stop:569 length:354 start_codon:yes stop_codon:yes gene_type:complete